MALRCRADAMTSEKRPRRTGDLDRVARRVKKLVNSLTRPSLLSKRDAGISLMGGFTEHRSKYSSPIYKSSRAHAVLMRCGIAPLAYHMQSGANQPKVEIGAEM
jgi:hypothetical protein